MQKLTQLFQSRKFYAALIGLIVISLRSLAPTIPLTDDQLTMTISLLISYIIGTALDR